MERTPLQTNEVQPLPENIQARRERGKERHKIERDQKTSRMFFGPGQRLGWPSWKITGPGGERQGRKDELERGRKSHK